MHFEKCYAETGDIALKYLITALTLTLTVLPFASFSEAATVQECEIRVMRPLPDDLGNRWQPGKILPVTIERDDADGGAYCASGGACVPRKVNGGNAVLLVNCRIGTVIGGGDRRLVPDPSRAGETAAQLMRSQVAVENTLSALGLSNASAGSLADEYVDNPRSETGRTVARALAGSGAALAALKRSHP